MPEFKPILSQELIKKMDEVGKGMTKLSLETAKKLSRASEKMLESADWENVGSLFEEIDKGLLKIYEGPRMSISMNIMEPGILFIFSLIELLLEGKTRGFLASSIGFFPAG